MSKSPKCINLRGVRSNQRERTITIRKEYDDNSAVLYKSFRLAPDVFNYYKNYASLPVLADFLSKERYEVIKWIVPLRK